MGHPSVAGAEYSLALSLLAWVFVAVQIYLYTLTVFPGLYGTHFIFWHALHPVVPLALASAAWHGRVGAAWAVVVVVVVAFVEMGYLVALGLSAAAAPAAEQGWLLAGSVGFLVTLGLAAVVLVHRIVALGAPAVHPEHCAETFRPMAPAGPGHRQYALRSGGATQRLSITSSPLGS